MDTSKQGFLCFSSNETEMLIIENCHVPLSIIIIRLKANKQYNTILIYHIHLCILLSLDFSLSARLRSSITIFLSNLNTDFMSSTELKTSAVVTGMRRRMEMKTSGVGEIIVTLVSQLWPAGVIITD